ncbi:MAG: hypothetical protein D6739_06505, partial [Nitrospirae bacterium]
MGRWIATLLLLLAPLPAAAEVRHHITARLEPAAHRIEARDRITGLAGRRLALRLAPTLEVVEVTGAAGWRRDGGGPLLI